MNAVGTRSALPVWSALLVLPLADGRAQRLNDPFQLVPGGDVRLAEYSPVGPGGAWIVYLADAGPDNVQNLYCMPGDGSAAPVQISDNTQVLEGIVNVTFSPDGTRVLYTQGIATATERPLYSVPVDGSLPPLDLSGPYVRSFQVTPDSSRVLFRGDILIDQRFLLCSVPIDGSSGPIVLNSPMPADTDVEEFAMNPDGTRVVYRADGLHSAPVDTAGAAVLISGNTATVLAGFKIGAEGARVAFVRQNGSIWELLSAPIDGTAPPVQLSIVGRSVQQDLVLSPDGQSVLHRAYGLPLNNYDLYNVAIDGSEASIQMNPALVHHGQVQSDVQVSADGTRVVYRADQTTDEVFALYCVPIDGSEAAVRLNGTLLAGEIVRTGFQIAPNGLGVAYMVGPNILGPPSKLFSALIDGSAVFALDAGLDFPSKLEIGANSTRALYVKRDSPGEHLWSVPLDGSAAAVQLSAGESLTDYQVVLGGLGVLYIADDDQRTVFELYGRPANGSVPAVRFNAPLPDNTVSGTVSTFAIAGERALYVADPGVENRVDLYSVPVSRAGAPIRISPSSVPSFHVIPSIGVGGTRAAFLGRTGTAGELYSVPVDGSQEAIVLNAPLVTNGSVVTHVVSPDGSQAVYLADQDTDGVNDLYRVPIDGSESPAKLSLATVVGASAFLNAMTADGSRVIYTGVQNTASRTELYSADGVVPPVELNEPLVSGGAVEYGAVLSADEAWVFYRADANVDSRIELFRVPCDGSANPVAISGTIVPGGKVAPGFRLTPDGTRVLFIADREVSSRNDLYSVAADGSAAPVRLNSIATAGDVDSVLLDPSGTLALFHFVPASGESGIYRMAVDGSGTQVLLTDGNVRNLVIVAPPGTPPGIQISPDGRLFYMASPGGGDYGLYVRPIDASVPPLQLNDALSESNVLFFRLDPVEGRAAYVANPMGSVEQRIYGVPFDGSRQPVDLAPRPSLPNSTVAPDFAFAADGSVLFRFDARQGGAFDLYKASPERGPRRADPPQRSVIR